MSTAPRLHPLSRERVPFRVGTLSRAGDFACRWGVRVLLAATVLFLIAPLVSVIGTAFNAPPLIMFPPQHWSLESFRQIPDIWYQAFYTSIEVALAAALIGSLIAVPASFALVRGALPGRGVFEALFRSPLQVPQIVLSVGMYQYYAELSAWNEHLSIGGFTGLVIAHTILVAPYIVGTTLARIAAIDPALEEASTGLGASSLKTFRSVTLPLVRPALTASFILAFVVSFDNVTLSLFLSADSTSSTLPVTLFSAIELSASPVIFAAAALTVALSVAVTFVLGRVIGIRAVATR
ncbi:putative Binding-protein-dependent transport systems inner membrane component [Paraburkholderia piptadeniae]|uniref:Binding-protein-dependent transport systems inner membrane component n=1 Tax=Paraburkholderia piptadeniae TaxID=1701573 RepID=A0A1N7S020_9BURK|nr:ABC transporter permease [Paraburkholderia piptadeniae]SIT40749.1 putative Binding-protein-dependent transport systems inner membrane component [Paraburkholderia piptadeniae]